MVEFIIEWWPYLLALVAAAYLPLKAIAKKTKNKTDDKAVELLGTGLELLGKKEREK